MDGACCECRLKCAEVAAAAAERKLCGGKDPGAGMQFNGSEGELV